jgi:hypothetical protein
MVGDMLNGMVAPSGGQVGGKQELHMSFNILVENGDEYGSRS